MDIKEMYKTILVVVALCSSSNLAAEDTSDLSASLSDLASDLAGLQNDIEIAYQDTNSVADLTWGWGATITQTLQATAPVVNVYKGADTSTAVLSEAAAGMTWRIIDKIPGWYAVELADPSADFTAGWVSAADGVPQAMAFSAIENESKTERVYRKITESVNKLKVKYDSNPYVSVSGFSVDISIPPSVNVEFAFK